MESSTKKYNKTLIACYLGFITQAIAANFAPLLFLTDGNLQYLALLAVPFYLLLVLWARVNAAAAMKDAFGEGSLFSYRLAEPGNYGR